MKKKEKPRIEEYQTFDHELFEELDWDDQVLVGKILVLEHLIDIADDDIGQNYGDIPGLTGLLRDAGESIMRRIAFLTHERWELKEKIGSLEQVKRPLTEQVKEG